MPNLKDYETEDWIRMLLSRLDTVEMKARLDREAKQINYTIDPTLPREEREIQEAIKAVAKAEMAGYCLEQFRSALPTECTIESITISDVYPDE